MMLNSAPSVLKRSFLNILTVIPSRLASSRLPQKALADINGLPMIVHVWQRGIEADLGPVVVACGNLEIADAVRSAGGTAVLTDPALNSGSDRVYAAVQMIDPESKFDVIINLQGDMPTAEPAMLRTLIEPLKHPAGEMATLASVITQADELESDAVVKAAIAFPYEGAAVGRALYFSRAVLPWGKGDNYHHIGLYAYKRSALARFSQWPAGILERRERLEQLRALEQGMRIDVSIVQANPLGVDRLEDLNMARELLL